MSQEWYYSIDGDRQGPVSAQELKKLVDAGTLKSADLVWKDGMADWVAAKTIKGLFGGATSSASTPAVSSSSLKAAEPKPARDDDDEEDDRPKKRRVVAENDDDEDDEPRRRRQNEDDEDDEEPRSKKKKKKRRVPDDVNSKKITAAILAIVFNCLGIHKFYLGLNSAGLIMLLSSLLTCGIGTLIMWPIGLIEGIIYLTKSDEEFYETYIVGQKGWF